MANDLKKTFIKAVRIDSNGNKMMKPNGGYDVCAFDPFDWDKMTKQPRLNWLYIEHIPQPVEGDVLEINATGGGETAAGKEFVKNGGVLEIPQSNEPETPEQKRIKELEALLKAKESPASAPQSDKEHLESLSLEELKELALGQFPTTNMKKETIISKLLTNK